MAKATNVPIKPFVNEALEEAKKRFHAAGMKITANEALIGGLVLAARAFPPDALMPYVSEFWRREASEKDSSTADGAVTEE
jgi:hypothetical protein